MLQKLLNMLLNVLYWLTGLAMFSLFVGIIVSPFEKGSPMSVRLLESASLLESSIASAISLLLSILLLFLIWRFQRLERWKGHMNILTLIGACLTISYLGWVYAPTWGLAPLLGHVLGLLVGGALGVGITVWEGRTINARKGALVAEQRGALDA
ncbi:MAG TPA: hypothetical protein VH590_16815 [Ktedonobacterales bacterium]|jgi:hypothetical protein